MEGSRGLYSLNPALVPMTLMARMSSLVTQPPVAAVARRLMPLLSTKRPAARLRMVEYRGVVTGTMIYDALPINDHFRAVDEDTLLGAMDSGHGVPVHVRAAPGAVKIRLDRRATMPARRILDNEEHLAVIETVRDAVTSRLAPQVAEIERPARSPGTHSARSARLGCSAWPTPRSTAAWGCRPSCTCRPWKRSGRCGHPAVGVSVHTLSCFPIATFGTREQQRCGFPTCSAGRRSVPTSAGVRRSDPRRWRCGPGGGDEYVLNGSKAWVTNGIRRLLHGHGENQRGARRRERYQLLPGSGRHTGVHGGAAGTEEG